MFVEHHRRYKDKTKRILSFPFSHPIRTRVGSSELKHVIPLTKPSLDLGLYARVSVGRGPDQPKRTQAHSLKGCGLQDR